MVAEDLHSAATLFRARVDELDHKIALPFFKAELVVCTRRGANGAARAALLFIGIVQGSRIIRSLYCRRRRLAAAKSAREWNSGS